MNNQFVLTNISPKNTSLVKDFQNFEAADFGSLYFSGDVYIKDSMLILIDGYVLPRNQVFDSVAKLNQYELIESIKNKDNFAQQVKGVFNVILIDAGRIEVFTDHFGFNSVFMYHGAKTFLITNHIGNFKKFGINLEIDPTDIAVKSILHHLPPSRSGYKNVHKSVPGTHIIVNHNGLKVEQYWEYNILLKYAKDINKNALTLNEFAELLKINFKNFSKYLKPEQHAITLTGGKDSRTGLAVLRSLGNNSLGFTYGNEFSRDALYAKKLANEIGIPHYVFTPPDDFDYFQKASETIIKSGNPHISLHRSHRLHSFAEMNKISKHAPAYYAGYSAGELLMGSFYDGLVLTKYLTDFWETSQRDPLHPLLNAYFHKTSSIEFDSVAGLLDKYKTLDIKHSLKDRQFYGKFEIGIPHHGQDVFLASQYFDAVYPFFIDIDLLEPLFSSRFSFFHKDGDSKNPIVRHGLYEFNLNIQHILAPDMDMVPFGKQGSYNTTEFLRGKYYWSMIKTFRYLFQNQKYPASYNYGQNFRDFLLKHLKLLMAEKSHALHEYFDVKEAISELITISGTTGELEMHRFSNIVQLYMLEKQYA